MFSAHWRGLELPKERGSSGGVANEIRNRHNDIIYIYIDIYTYYIYPNPEMMPFSLRVHLTCFFVEI